MGITARGFDLVEHPCRRTSMNCLYQHAWLQ